MSNTSEKHRERVRAVLEKEPLCETDIRALAGVSGAWLSHALVGLLHQGAVRFLGPRAGKRGKGRAFVWEAVPTVRPLVQVLPDGDGGNSND